MKSFISSRSSRDSMLVLGNLAAMLHHLVIQRPIFVDVSGLYDGSASPLIRTKRRFTASIGGTSARNYRASVPSPGSGKLIITGQSTPERRTSMTPKPGLSARLGSSHPALTVSRSARAASFCKNARRISGSRGWNENGIKKLPCSIRCRGWNENGIKKLPCSIRYSVFCCIGPAIAGAAERRPQHAQPAFRTISARTTVSVAVA